MPRQALLLLWLTALALVVAALGLLTPRWLPVSSMVVVLLLGGFLLRMRTMVLLYLVVAAALAFSAVWRPPDAPPSPPGGYLVVALTALMLMAFVRTRERLGLQGTLGDAMLVDLRDRLRAQGRVPQLPASWHVETVLRPAFGDSFSGDFLVAARSASGHGLELALVDVSGKGQSAGTRALALSGAFGGLLGAMPVEEFLPAANAYLLRQDWPEGFATAVHVALDLSSGEYRLSYAGHPPAARGERGRPWALVQGGAGPALGLVADAEYPAVRGRLDDGAALFVYTDGMVETPGVDLSVGTQALLELAARVCDDGCQDGDAERLVDAAEVAEDDDRALVLVWRTACGAHPAR
ncbi:PP2C family protein-serine/threonine phosphatase [Quadrisphaera sp. DSM 44207]|uniref:PP2C family protein-serine/threonine phosphatase n=1 Tax=Quadrisphaera sp. DSM 44207 TaxID=1881057 RepID=UPI000891DA4E|nr:PP2C family protein-serine/threonine phosphatase [Quadrisphaera sp. DSM 44207]SDQ06066.1 Stage II sporulation protein E (SpoIIE) [Quadrisphaera sp. DSM 44207]